MCSSLYPPDETFIERFKAFPELVNLDFTVELETTTLDAFCQEEGIDRIDFLQIDVQGAELLVLQGAETLLERGILAIQSEVEFEPLYKDQPLFGDIDRHLRQRGMSFFDFEFQGTPGVRRRSPVQSNRHPGQRLWADAFYFYDLLGERTPSQLKTPENFLKLACIADILGFLDYAFELLEFLTLNYGADPAYNVADCILESLGNMPEFQSGLQETACVQTLQPYFSDACKARYLSGSGL